MLPVSAAAHRAANPICTTLFSLSPASIGSLYVFMCMCTRLRTPVLWVGPLKVLDCVC